jgi:hypothetical protein
VDRTLSWLAGTHNPDALARALTEVDVAIGMVALGAAVSVRLCNLEAAEEAAFDAAAHAQAAGIAFSLRRDGPRSISMIVGPRIDDKAAVDARPTDDGERPADAPA